MANAQGLRANLMAAFVWGRGRQEKCGQAHVRTLHMSQTLTNLSVKHNSGQYKLIEYEEVDGGLLCSEVSDSCVQKHIAHVVD